MRRKIDASWLQLLCADKTYFGIDVLREYGKMMNWCKVNGKMATERRFINWLNRIERPLKAVYPKTNYTTYQRKVREPSDDEFKLAGELARAELERFRQQMRGSNG